MINRLPIGRNDLPTRVVTNQRSVRIVTTYRAWPVGASIRFQIMLNGRTIYDQIGVGSSEQSEWGCSLHGSGVVTATATVIGRDVDLDIDTVIE